MFISRRGPNRQYAYITTSYREDGRVKTKDEYLGRIVDYDKGIFKSKDRGVFTFDMSTGEYGVPESSYVPNEVEDRRKREHHSVDFGDAFFVYEFLHVTGFLKIIDKVSYGNPDTFHAMVLFYVLSSVANCDAINWFEGSIVKLLYPKANMTSQRLSDFLESIGSKDNIIAFEKEYIPYIYSHYSNSHGILIDSTGLANSIYFWMTQTSNHNGKISNEMRMIFVQKTTGLPLFYQPVPGNIVDVSTLERTLLHLESLNVEIDEALMDCGYNSKDNLDLFYGSDHTVKINYITRVKSNDQAFVGMIHRHLSTLESAENFIKYQDRYLFIVHEQIMVGRNEDNPATIYLGLDTVRMSDEQRKLFKRANKDHLSVEQVFQLMQGEGLFGLISGRELSNDEILPCYYQRQDAEQIFDFAKNYTRLLPLRVRNEMTLSGHLFMSYIATILVKMLQLQLKTQDMYLGSRLVTLRNLKCTIYSQRIVVDNPQKVVNDTFASFKISVPASLPLVNGVLQYHPPAERKIITSLPEIKSIESEKAEKEATKKVDTTENTNNEEQSPPKRRRGRPPKPKPNPEAPVERRKRGRPPKPKPNPEVPVEKRKRGRPPKTRKEEPEVKKKRGRPPKTKATDKEQVKSP